MNLRRLLKKNIPPNHSVFFYNLYAGYLSLLRFFFKKRTLSIQSFEEYCNSNNSHYLIIKSSELLQCYIPIMFEVNETDGYVTLESHDIYISEIYDALVVGDNNFVICNDKYLSDIPFYKRAETYNMEYGATSKIDLETKKAVVKYWKSNTIIERAISIVGAASNNYYHFSVDLLARLYYIDKLDEYDYYDLLIDERAIEYFSELISQHNKKNRKIIPIRRGHSYRIRKLVYPSFLSFNPIYLSTDVNLKKTYKYGDFYESEAYLSFKHKIDFSNFIVTQGYPKKLFISRRDVVRNDLINEEEVEKVFVSIGFTVISPGLLNFYQQYMYFRHAEIIVGAEGAAFTNILYSKKKLEIVCILEQSQKKYFVSSLSKILGHNVIYLAAQKTNNGKYHLDLDYLNRFLSYKNMK